MSLLALATGALAMPQTSYGDVLFTDLSSNPVNVGPTADPSYLLTLPGTHQFSFDVRTFHGTTLAGDIHAVIAGQRGGGLNVYVNIKTTGNSFVLPVGKSVTWNQINQPGLYRSAVVGTSATYNGAHFPNAYDHQYLAFQFKDSTQGNKLLNGWIELGEHFPATGGGPEVTIYGYAIETSGNPLATGAVPEPSSGSLLAFGAMTLGAAGIRNWRQKRAK
jgi:hypothetical protein